MATDQRSLKAKWPFVQLPVGLGDLSSHPPTQSMHLLDHRRTRPAHQALALHEIRKYRKRPNVACIKIQSILPMGNGLPPSDFLGGPPINRSTSSLAAETPPVTDRTSPSWHAFWEAARGCNAAGRPADLRISFCLQDWGKAFPRGLPLSSPSSWANLADHVMVRWLLRGQSLGAWHSSCHRLLRIHVEQSSHRRYPAMLFPRHAGTVYISVWSTRLT